MSGSDLTVRVGGDSATGGIVTTGEVFARIAREMVWSQGVVLDMLIAFVQDSIVRYYPLVR